MGNNKKTVGLSIVLILLIVIFALASCSPAHRFSRLVKKHPDLIQTDTVVVSDTIKITIPSVQRDTVMLLDSFIVSLKDTITITKDNLVVKLTQVHDSIYLDARCDTVFIDKIIEKKVPVKYYEIKERFNIRNYISCIGIAIITLLALIVLFRLVKFFK